MNYLTREMVLLITLSGMKKFQRNHDLISPLM